MADHLTDPDIRGYRNRSLTPPHLLRVSSHLTECEACRSLVMSPAEVEAAIKLIRLGVQTEGVGTSHLSYEAMEEYVDHKLDDAATTDVETHIRCCKFCTEELRKIEALKDEADDSSRPSLSWSILPAFGPRWAFAAGTIAIFLTAGLLYLLRLPSGVVSAQRLLGQAYSEQRTMELRFSDAQHGPLRITKGANGSAYLDKPQALLDAEALIHRRLQKEPDNPVWLDVKGRAYLLEADYESAVATLERALQERSSTVPLLIDAASAYYERGQKTDQAQDYSKALELLSQALVKSPDDPVALFNRALVSERLSLYRQAAEDWEHYLRIDPKSAWSEEASQHLQAIRQKTTERKSNANEPLLDTDRFVRQVVLKRRESWDVVDHRAEEYLSLALVSWLPQAFAEDASFPDKNKKRTILALQVLAQTLKQMRDDRLLLDLINVPERVPSLAVKKLALAIESDASGDYASGLAQAEEAEKAFARRRNRAGFLRARFEELYAEQFSGRAQPCADNAKLLAREATRYHYTWLQIQASLEQAICSNRAGEFGEAKRLIMQASALATDAHFQGLRLRAIMAIAWMELEAGSRAQAWNLIRQGLWLYWTGVAPTMRAYALYMVMHSIADAEGNRHAEISMLKEALDLVNAGPDRALEGEDHYLLGIAELRVGDFERAAAEFREGQRLFFLCTDTTATQRHIVESKIGVAEAESQLGHSQIALAILRNIEKQVPETSFQEHMLGFYRTLGDVLSRAGDSAGARRSFENALRITEGSVTTLPGFRDRLSWIRENAHVYRSLVEIKFKGGDVEGALALWERFRASALRLGGQESSGSALPGDRSAERTTLGGFELVERNRAALNHETVISYAEMSDGLILWAYDDRGVVGRWIPVTQEELNAKISRFLAACSDRSSDIALLARYGAELYTLLVAPVRDRISEDRIVVVEPDGLIADLPMEALTTPTGAYFGDPHVVITSPGIAYREALKPPVAISPAQNALIIGAPAFGPDEKLPNIADSVSEVEEIASSFSNAKVLVGKQATKAAVLRALPSTVIIHYAGHSLFDLSGVALPLVDDSHDPGGKLALLNFQDVPSYYLHRCLLVFLAACSTSRVGSGEWIDHEGLVVSLLHSGIPCVIASRWDVDSTATRRFVRAFYDSLLSGRSPAASLHTAQKQIRAQPSMSHPYYWAAFAIFGKS